MVGMDRDEGEHLTPVVVFYEPNRGCAEGAQTIKQNGLVSIGIYSKVMCQASCQALLRHWQSYSPDAPSFLFYSQS